MNTLEDYIGSIFSFKENPNKKKRIIEIDSENVYVVEMNKKMMFRPLTIETNIFTEYINKQEIILIKDETGDNTPQEMSEHQKKIIQKRWESIGLRWRDPEIRPDFLDLKKRKALVKKISSELNLSENQVKRLISRFWQNGMRKESLIPEKRGSKKGLALNRGRKAKGGAGLKITKEEQERFKEAYQKYHIREGKSIETTFTCLLKEYYTEQNGEDSQHYIYQNQQKIPTINQFRYWIRTHQDKQEEIISQVGEKEFENSYSILTSATTVSTKGAGARAELDATYLPIELVSSADRNVCVGTPLLELLVDVYSKMILGFTLTLENESYRTGALCLLNCGEDKVEFAKKYGLDICFEDWPVQHLPQIILTDNGPFKSRYAEVLERDFHVYLEDTTARKGSAKGNVERRNRIFSDYVKDSLPGAARHLEKGRGRSDPADSACLTLRDLTKLIIKKIIELNHSPIPDYPLPPEAIESGVPATPVGLWNWSIQKNTDHLIYVKDPDKLKISLLPRVKCGRKIRREGIRWNNFTYTSKDARTQNWLINHMGDSVEIAYNPIDLRKIYIIDQDKILALELNEKYKNFSLMSQEEADYYQRLNASQLNKQKEEAQLIKMETLDLQDKLIKEAKSQEEGRKHKKDKKGNRRKEIREERIKETLGEERPKEVPEENDYEADRRIQSQLFQQRVQKIKNRKD